MVTATLSSLWTSKHVSLPLPPDILSELLSQHQHLARQHGGWGVSSASVLSPASNCMLLSEKPLFLTEPASPSV